MKDVTTTRERNRALLRFTEDAEGEDTMPKGMVALAALVLAVSITLPAAAQAPPAEDGAALVQRGQSKQDRKQAREAARAVMMLSEYASIYTDIVEQTLAATGPTRCASG